MTRLNPNWLMTVATAFGAVSLAACGAHDGDPGASEVATVAETEQAVIATAVTSQVSSNFTVRAGATVTATATCPSNSKVVAGGYATFCGFLGLRVIESRPNGSNGWQIKVVNNNPDVFSLSGSVSAECLSGTRAVAVTPRVSLGMRIDPGKQSCTVAQCADTGVTEVLTGVGFSSTSAFELTSITQAGTPRFFTVCGLNTNQVNPIQFQAISSCVRGVTGGLARQQTIWGCSRSIRSGVGTCGRSTWSTPQPSTRRHSSTRIAWISFSREFPKEPGSGREPRTVAVFRAAAPHFARISVPNERFGAGPAQRVLVTSLEQRQSELGPRVARGIVRGGTGARVATANKAVKPTIEETLTKLHELKLTSMAQAVRELMDTAPWPSTVIRREARARRRPRMGRPRQSSTDTSAQRGQTRDARIA
jgi:hypothetical protein